jgi:hypothetical protein
MPAHMAGSKADGGVDSAPGRSVSGWHHLSRPIKIAAIALLCLVLLGLLFARNPYLLSNPQMWTEDLLVYFLDDLILKADAILVPYNGTIQLAPRLVAFWGGLFPTSLVPVVYSAVSVCAVAGMVALTFVSTAFRGIGRWVAVLLIFLVPVGSEVFLGMAYVQWILGPSIALALYERSPGRAYARALLSAYAIVAFSSPIGAMAVPFALVKVWRERSRFAGRLLFLSVVSSISMAGPVIGRVRSDTTAAPMADKLHAGLTVLYEWATGPLPVRPWIALTVSIFTVTCVVLFLWWYRQRSQRATLYFLGFGFVILTASLAVANTAILQQFGDAERYFYIPALLFLWALLSLPSESYDNVKAWIVLLVCVTSTIAYVKPATVLQSDIYWRDVATCIDTSTDVCVSAVNPPYLGRFLVPSRHMLASNVSGVNCCLGYRMRAIITDKSLVGVAEPAAQLSMQPKILVEQNFTVPASDMPDTSPHLVDVRLSQTGDASSSALIHWKVFRQEGDTWSLMRVGHQQVAHLAPSRSISVPIIGAKAGETLRIQLTLDDAAPAAAPVDLALFRTTGTSLSAADVNGQPLEDRSLGLSVRYK